MLGGMTAPHGHVHGSADAQAHGTGRLGRLRHLVRPHSHEAADQVDAAMEASAGGMRALWISLAVLAGTALVQAAVVAVSGSVALLGDTLHNAADAVTAVPLGIAFLAGRRLPNRRYTYGYGRAEDLAGVVIVLVIAASSALAAYEAVTRLAHPRPVSNLVAVAVAAVIGFAGNELVARYRIRVGRRIGSAALVADGVHARTDGFTSLAVLLGAGGVAAGPGYPHRDLVAGGGDRAGAHAELAGVEPRIAVQREDPADRGDAARREDVERAAGRLLGGLEDEPDPPGQQAGRGLLGQEQAGPEQHGGVHVVTAGVAGTRHGGAVRDVLVVRHGQRVHVRAERDDRPLGVGNLLGADVDEQAGPLGQDHRPQARRGQAQRDPAGGPVLVEGQLRMSVKITAELDQLRLVFSQERVQIREQISARLISGHAHHPRACRIYLRRTRSRGRLRR